MKKYNVLGFIETGVIVDQRGLINLLEQEKLNLLKHEDYYVEDEYVFKRDYRFSDEKVRKATTEEREVYEAISKLTSYLRKQLDK